MAGYIMTLSDIDSLTYCVKTGTYSTNLGTPKGNWMTYHEGTFADYLSMKPGDSIYFFIKRKIYGIGKLIEIHSECRFLNYIGADRPVDYSKKNYKKLEPLLDEGAANNRCLCVFEPSPLFFLNGVDMDDALNSNPDRFRMLRAMWKVSFIKVDDDENQALMDIILKRNEEDLLLNKNAYPFSKVLHNQIRDKNTEQYNTFECFFNSVFYSVILARTEILCDKSRKRISEILYRHICNGDDFHRNGKRRHNLCTETVYNPLHHKYAEIHYRLLQTRHSRQYCYVVCRTFYKLCIFIF